MMAENNIISNNRLADDAWANAYAAKLQREEKLDAYVQSSSKSNLQNSFAEKITEKSNISNLLTQDAAATLSISALGEEELEKARQSWDNHPVSALYRSEIPVRENADNGYKIGGAIFSKEEFNAARNLIEGVGSKLKKGYLSYRDYANMEMAQQVVDKFAYQNFDKNKAEVISRAMKDFNDNLLRDQSRLLNGKALRENDDSDSGKYFGIEVKIPKEVRNSGSQGYSATSIATNKELIDAIRDRIRNTDISDKNETNRLKEFYRDIMKPIYSKQYPFQREADVDDAISRDLKNMMSIAEYTWR